MNPHGDAAAAARRERRQWIREHHPDRGGDPTVFTAGLAAHGRQRTDSPRPSVRRTRPLRRRLRSIRRHLRTLLFRRRPRRRRVI